MKTAIKTATLLLTFALAILAVFACGMMAMMAAYPAPGLSGAFIVLMLVSFAAAASCGYKLEYVSAGLLK